MLNQIDLSRIDLNLLVVFDIVLRERHVGRAAEKLNLSASAVSHGIGRLRRLLKDPLFLRTPKGVIPTERAEQLAAPVADLLEQARAIVATANPFNPMTSNRRFAIGAPDGVSAVVIPDLLESLRGNAPGIDVSIRQILPQIGATFERAWQPALDAIETRAIDIAIIPAKTLPTRFAQRILYKEEFVVAARRDHTFAKAPTVKKFCEEGHVLVSTTGDPHGFVDAALAERGLKRRIALTVPNFMMAMAVVAETELIAALPRALVTRYAARFGIAGVAPPLPVRRDAIRIVTSKAALADTGVCWLFELLARGASHRDRP